MARISSGQSCSVFQPQVTQMDPVSISICIAGLSLILSVTTLWLTMRGGTVMMTQPTTVFLGPDGSLVGPRMGAKVYMRTLLYSTGKRGRIIENMYMKVRVGESVQNFNVWVYGERGGLSRGSGLFVGMEGVTCNHHFLLPKSSSFAFTAGDYTLEVYAKLVGARVPILLHRVRLGLLPEHVAGIREDKAGIYFDWGPDLNNYHAHIEERGKNLIGNFLGPEAPEPC